MRGSAVMRCPFSYRGEKRGSGLEREYCTVADEAQAELVERRSRFIATVAPVTTEEEAQAFIARMKKQYWDARHNVSAYCLRKGQVSRCSDDGEPAGTAGMPVLEVLQKRGITDCAVVVTRYFGGILLGTGGLVRAYSQSASLGLDKAEIQWQRFCAVGTVRCSYTQYGRIQPLIIQAGGVITDTEFADDVMLQVYFPLAAVEPFQRELTEVSAGQLVFKKEKEEFRAFLKKV